MNARRPSRLVSGLALSLLVVGAVGASACAAKDDTSDLPTRAGEAIPTADGVKLTTPGTSGGSSTSSIAPSTRLADLPGGGGYAEYYRLTRNFFDGVNLGTGWVLGTVIAIVHYPATSVSGNVATWGPASEALDPADWKLVVTETAHEEFDYELQGRKKGDGGSFQVFLHGNGFGKTHAKHGQGTFVLDYDVANALDPSRLGADQDSGKLTITHDVGTPTRSITASRRPSMTERKWDITTTRAADDSGTVLVDATDDLDGSATTADEHVTFSSQFAPTGDGRAKVTIDGGDLPAGLTVHADECWTAAPSFARSYYGDDSSLEPTFGDAGVCVFPLPNLAQGSSVQLDGRAGSSPSVR